MSHFVILAWNWLTSSALQHLWLFSVAIQTASLGQLQFSFGDTAPPRSAIVASIWASRLWNGATCQQRILEARQLDQGGMGSCMNMSNCLSSFHLEEYKKVGDC